MKFAIVNGTKKSPEPRETGECEFCNAKVISKCGKVKIWHWAHKGKLVCDPWWENETQWHRDWKDKFPIQSQEFIQYDEKGEKHIADVKTEKGWVLEFQHSFIPVDERNSRNSFYKKLVWIIDGTRRLKDGNQFFKLINENIIISAEAKIYKAYLDECTLLKEWRNCESFVFFDFGEDRLWCLIPGGEGAWGAVAEIPRSLLIRMHSNNENNLEGDYESFTSGLLTIVAEYKANPPELNSCNEYALFPPRYLAYRMRNKRRQRS